MAVKVTKAEKKVNYDKKLCKLLDTYQQILIVGADNVGSNQLQMIRKGLRGDSVVLMGKNTMMKRSIRIHAEKTGNNAILALIECLVVCFDLSSSLYYYTATHISIVVLYHIVTDLLLLVCLVSEKICGIGYLSGDLLFVFVSYNMCSNYYFYLQKNRKWMFKITVEVFIISFFLCELHYFLIY